MTRAQAHAEFGKDFYVDIRSKEMAASIMRLLLDESSFFTSFSNAFAMFKKGKNLWPDNGSYLQISDGNCSFRIGASRFCPLIPDHEFLAFLQGKTLYEPGTDFDLAFQKLMTE